MSDKPAKTVEKTGKDTRHSRGTIGAAVGALVGFCLAYAAGVQSFGLALAAFVGSICGGGVGRACGTPAGESQPVLKASRMREHLKDELINGMNEADRRKVNLSDKVFMTCFLTASCYALMLMVLESANAAGEYLRFFAPLTGFLSDFLPRADAVSSALREHGYEARAKFAEHIIVMTRLFCIPALVAMVISYKIVYRVHKSVHIHCTRGALNGYVLVLCLGMPFLFGAMLALDTGYWIILDFHTPLRSTGGISWVFQYHHTTIAAFAEVACAATWPIFVYNLQLIIVLSRAQLVYIE